MGPSIFDGLFAIWQALNQAIVVGAMGLALIIGVPALYFFTKQANGRSVFKAVLSSLFVWAWLGVLVIGASLLEGYTHSHEGYGEFLALLVLLLAVGVALVSTVVLTWKYRSRWPVVAILAAGPIVWGWASLNHLAEDWSTSNEFHARKADRARKAWLSAHPVYRAVFEGDESALVSALTSASREAIDDQDDSGKTALHLASGDGKIEMMRYLLHAGASQRRTNSRGTPADWATQQDRVDVLPLLFAQGGELTSGEAIYALLKVKPEALEGAHFSQEALESALMKLADEPLADEEKASRAKDVAALAALGRPNSDANAKIDVAQKSLLKHLLARFWKNRGERRARLARMVSWLLEHSADAQRESEPNDTSILHTFLLAAESGEDLFPPDQTFFVTRALLSHGVRVLPGRRWDDRSECSTAVLFMATFQQTITEGAQKDETLTGSTPSQRLAQLAAGSPTKTSEDFVELLVQIVTRADKAIGLYACVANRRLTPSALLPDIERFLPAKERVAFRKLVPSNASAL